MPPIGGTSVEMVVGRRVSCVRACAAPAPALQRVWLCAFFFFFPARAGARGRYTRALV